MFIRNVKVYTRECAPLKLIGWYPCAGNKSRKTNNNKYSSQPPQS
jgi:hypothetical protein